MFLKTFTATWLGILTFVSLAAAAPGSAGQPSEPPDPTMAIRGAAWFDGEGFAPADWYVVDGRLTRDQPPRVDVSLDLRGRYILPGLTDAHNHDLQTAAFAPAASDRYLAHGIYRSVQMCAASTPGHAAFLGRPGTVHATFVDACVSAPDGHPLGISMASMARQGLEPDVDQARKEFNAVSDEVGLSAFIEAMEGKDSALIKVILIQSGRHRAVAADERMFGFRGLDPALARSLTQQARQRGWSVIAHVETADDFALAVDMGAAFIAHLPGYLVWHDTTLADYRISAETAEAAAARGVTVITTASAAALVAGPDGPDAALTRLQADNLATLIRAGVRLAIGSDNPRGTVIDELVYLDELGVMSRADLLKAATSETAEAFFPDDRYGVFLDGAEASFTAYARDPLEDLQVLRRPVLRVQSGAILPEMGETSGAGTRGFDANAAGAQPAY